MDNKEILERFHSDDALMGMIIKRQDKTERVLEDHVSLCGRLQKWQIVIGCTILLLVEAHSPEVGVLIGRILKAVLG